MITDKLVASPSPDMMPRRRRVKPYKTAYDSGNAYWMARFSKEVYTKKDDEQIPDGDAILAALKNDDPQFENVVGFDKDSAQAMLVVHKDYIAITFRGTNELKDWLDNINAFATQRLFGSFHRGFYQSVMEFWQEIENKINLLKAPRPVWFTGHSLGGAMAVIAAAMYIHEDRPFSGLYTFGQPRCMDRSTSRLFNLEAGNRYYRFQNNNDIVTRIPSRLMNYSHTGKCIYISEEKELCDSPGFWFKFLDTIDGIMEKIGDKNLSIDGIDDHSMDDYLEAIEKWDDKPLKDE